MRTSIVVLLALFSTPAWALCGDPDGDLDGIPDVDEGLIGTNIANPDTDGDGLSDGEEDFDADGLNNYDELCLTGTSMLQWDTDGDGWPDIYFDADGDGVLPLGRAVRAVHVADGLGLRWGRGLRLRRRLRRRWIEQWRRDLPLQLRPSGNGHGRWWNERRRPGLGTPTG